ncbi:pilin [Halomonas sp. LS-001]
MYRENERGLTLIELLVVLALIGIISAIAVPRYQSYQLRANANAALADAKALQSPVEAQVQGIGAPAQSTSEGIVLEVSADDGSATITSTRSMGEVTLTRNTDGIWVCEHTFDIELNGCQLAGDD